MPPSGLPRPSCRWQLTHFRAAAGISEIEFPKHRRHLAAGRADPRRVDLFAPLLLLGQRKVGGGSRRFLAGRMRAAAAWTSAGPTADWSRLMNPID